MMTQMRMEIEKSLSLFRGTAEETRCDIIFAERSGWCHSGYLSQLAVMYFFLRLKALFIGIENAKFWSALASLGYFGANLCIFAYFSHPK